MPKRFIYIFLFFFTHTLVSAQELYYSPAESDVENLLKYEAIGRLGKNILIYRENKLQHQVSVYGNSMNLIRKVELEFLPKDVLKVDFVNIGTKANLVFQFLKKGRLYTSFTSLNEEGKMIQDPIVLDSVQLKDNTEFPLFQVIASPNKSKIMFLYFHPASEILTRITTTLYSNEMDLVERADLLVSTPDGSDKLNQFQLDKEGNLVFLRNVLKEESLTEVSRTDILVKPVGVDAVKNATIQFNKIGIRDLKIAIDNKNARVIAASIFTGGKKGYAQGIFSLVVDMATGNVSHWRQEYFSDSLRKEIKIRHTSESRIFDDYFLDEIIPYTNGGFALLLESRTTEGNRVLTGDNRNLNRSEPLPPRVIYNGNTADGSLFTMVRTPYQPFQMPIESSARAYIKNTAGNMVLFSFSFESELQDIQVLRKAQSEDRTAHLISYALVKSGSGIRFLYNEKDKPEMGLRSVGYLPGERLKRNPSIKGAIPNMRFMTRYGTQIGANECIIPCVKSNYGSFARVVF
jgi:hypothetical protein